MIKIIMIMLEMIYFLSVVMFICTGQVLVIRLVPHDEKLTNYYEKCSNQSAKDNSQ